MATAYPFNSLKVFDQPSWERLVNILTLGGIVKGLIYETSTVNPASLSDGAGATISVTVTGAALGDHVIAVPGADMTDVVWSASVISANTVEIRVQNESLSTRDIASSTWKFIIVDLT